MKTMMKETMHETIETNTRGNHKMKKFTKILKNQKGLTLIELLAVIVILAIVAAIAVPAIGNVIANSRDKAVLADTATILSGAKLAVNSGGCAQTESIVNTVKVITYTCGYDELNTYVEGIDQLESGDQVTKVGDLWTIKYGKLARDWNIKPAPLDKTDSTITETKLLEAMGNKK
ncbi:prepilin-type N-terminal cleavage/methylation domain-containing protein [Psychrobacillus sp. L4]|uniref:prepilin-type N-terminal cleavage/methylation domain-containing protein n=1 Tax=Psychrobacillus sp. L4 TaxID=3236892 RepID=UPI0036F26133